MSLLIGLKWPLPNIVPITEIDSWYWGFYEKPGCDQGYFLLLSAFSPFMIMTLIILFYTRFAGMALKHSHTNTRFTNWILRFSHRGFCNYHFCVCFHQLNYFAKWKSLLIETILKNDLKTKSLCQYSPKKESSQKMWELVYSFVYSLLQCSCC